VEVPSLSRNITARLPPPAVACSLRPDFGHALTFVDLFKAVVRDPRWPFLRWSADRARFRRFAGIRAGGYDGRDDCRGSDNADMPRRSSAKAGGDRLRVVVGLVWRAARFRQRQTNGALVREGDRARRSWRAADGGGFWPPPWGPDCSWRFAPGTCEDEKRHDLSGGVLWVVVGMVQNEVRNADTLEVRDRAQCNKPVATRPTRPPLRASAQGWQLNR